jgi:hypothetical protein
MTLFFYMDYIDNYYKIRELGIQTIVKPLKQIRDGKTPNCQNCGTWFPKDPKKWYWNEDLHRYEWHCTTQDRPIYRDGIFIQLWTGCVTGVGEDPVVLHSGFESVDELSPEEIERLRKMGYTDEMLGITEMGVNGE